MLKNILTSTITTILISTLVLSFIPTSTPSTDGNKSVLGSQVETVLVWLGGGVKIGNLGNNVTKVIASTCDLIIGRTSQTGSTSIAYDCAVQGARSGDIVMAQLATTTIGSNILRWHIADARASTTPNYVTVSLQNLTGTSVNPSVNAIGSSTRVLIYKN